MKRTKTVYAIVEDIDWDSTRVIAVCNSEKIAKEMINSSKRDVHYTEVGFFEEVVEDE